MESGKPQPLIGQGFPWSECRDSNSRPLGPEPSAIPNFATPRKNDLILTVAPLIYQGFARLSRSAQKFIPLGSTRIFSLGLSQTTLITTNSIPHFDLYVKPFFIRAVTNRIDYKKSSTENGNSRDLGSRPFLNFSLAMPNLL